VGGPGLCPSHGGLPRLRSRLISPAQQLPASAKRPSHPGPAVRLKWQVGRWRCRDSLCKRKIFCQRLAGITGKHAQETDRLTEILQSVGYALGGRAGERLGVRLVCGSATILCSAASRKRPDHGHSRELFQC
jgi:hypothetical protein